MILLMISGIIISEYTFSFLNINSGMAISRLIHLSASHLGFILVSIHMGMHLGIFLPKNTNNINKINFYINSYLWCICPVFQKNTFLCFPH